MAESITFLASIAALQSAMTIASDGGARIKIDIPEEYLDQAYALMKYRECVLKITVNPE